MAGTTYAIKIVLATNAREGSRDLQGFGDAARGAGAGVGEAGDKAKGAGKEIVSLGSLAKEAAANFAGYLSAQAVLQGLTKAAQFAKDTILGLDDEMTQSLAIMGDVSEGVRTQMETTARETAVKYNTAVADVAQGYYFLASAGYDAKTSQLALGQVTAFAKAGMIDMERATELAADAQNAMGLKSDNATDNLRELTRITDVLVKANVDANGSTEQFADALTNKAAASARLAGIELESVVAVLEAFASQGLKGLKAGEAFSIILRDLQTQARVNADAFDALGITVFDAQGKFAGFPTIIGQIEKALKGQSVEQANATLATLGFTVEGANYVKTLIGMSGEITKYEDKLKSAGGATQQIAERQMQSMIEQLKHLRAYAAELALKGFDLMIDALTWLRGQFGPSLEAGAQELRTIAEFAQPAVKLLGMLGGGAVVGGIMALAAALNTATGFLREHEAILQVLASVAIAAVIAKLTAMGLAAASVAADLAAIRIYEIAGGFDALVASMRAATATSGLLGGAMTGLRAVLSSTAFQVGALATLVLAFTQSFMESRQQAEAWANGISSAMDPTSIRSMSDTLKRFREEHDRLTKQIQDENPIGQWLGGMADLLIPFHDVEGSVRDMAEQIDQADARAEDLGKRFEESRAAMNAMARDLSPAAQQLKATTGQFSLLNAQGERLKAAKVNQEVANISAELARVAMAAGIDISKPVDDWKDALHAAYVESVNADPTLQSLHEAFATVADSASSAEDAVKAYKQAIDALMGVHINEQQAENQFAGALDAVHEKVAGGVNLLDAYNARNREARDAVLGAADAALNHSVAIYEEGGGLAAATAALAQHREQLIVSMIQTGMTRQAAEAYLDTLGLTPKNIETIAQLHKEEAQAKAEELIRKEEEAARSRMGTINVDTSAADANLNRFMGHLANVMQSIFHFQGSVPAGPGGNPVTRARGGITLHQYAAGGMENHIAQITPPGVMRLWGEPETGGEAYIPLSPQKRDRSMAILEQVAMMFGYNLVRYAQGGMTGGWSNAGPGIVVGPGAVQVSVSNPATGVDVEGAVDRALDRFTRNMRTEMRTRRYATAGAR